MKVLIIGGGAAGLLAAISSSKNGNEVLILEKMEMPGRKILITGKGRCNITSSLPMEDFIKNVPGNGKFLYSAFNNFTNRDILKILKRQGIETKVERGNRIFPVSDKAQDVQKALIKEAEKNGVKIITNCKVNKILVNKNKEVYGISVEINGEKKNIEGPKVILATGGKSYPGTGSTGDGYMMAEELGHTINRIKPSLVPLTSKGNSLNICKEMQGLGLKNIAMKLIDIDKNKLIYEDFGEMLFTHFGVSGPTVLSSSAHLLRYKNVDELLKNNKIILRIDLKPALSEKKLDDRILRDFNEEKNKEFKNCLNKLLPRKMIDVVIKMSKINPNKQVNEVTKEERKNLVMLLKNFDIYISGFRPIEEAIITSGGIKTNEINPKTMESKFIKGLYFAGEIIDVDAYTGGFNLQIAYSTGYTAGMN